MYCGPRGKTMPNAAPSAALRRCRKALAWPLGVAGAPDLARTRAKKAGSPYPAAPALSLDQSKDGDGKKEIPPACVKSSSAF